MEVRQEDRSGNENESGYDKIGGYGGALVKLSEPFEYQACRSVRRILASVRRKSTCCGQCFPAPLPAERRPEYLSVTPRDRHRADERDDEATEKTSGEAGIDFREIIMATRVAQNGDRLRTPAVIIG